MNREDAMRKVRACLRLSTSANANEAAAALRQARALMAKYGLTEADAEAAEITSADAVTRSRGAMAPHSLVVLARIIADGYRCRSLISCYKVVGGGRGGKTRVEFYGARSDAQISAYAFTVLRRQLEAEKSRFLAEKARKSRASRTHAKRAQLGEMFALGWVSAVRDLFPREEITEAYGKALQLAIERSNGDLPLEVIAPPTEKKQASRQEMDAQVAGFFAGQQATLHKGVGQDGAGHPLTGPAQLEHHA